MFPNKSRFRFNLWTARRTYQFKIKLSHENGRKAAVFSPTLMEYEMIECSVGNG